jgi:hypothetical protein
MNRLKLFLLSGIFLIMIPLSACSFPGREIQLSIKEADVNQLLLNAASEDLPFKVDRVDMRDGSIKVYISYRQPDGSEIQGSYDLEFTVDDGKLAGKISNVDMQGLNINPGILDQVSSLILREFTTPGAKLGDRVTYQSINIDDDEIQLVIRVSL